MAAPRILHYPGSKWSMADWIISNMPEHTTYLEPFFGSGAVFFNKPRSPLETINDIDGDVVNLFRVIRERPEELAHMVHWTPYAREEYYASYEPVEDDIERARRFIIRTRQAIGAKTSDRTGWKNNVSGDKCPSSPPARQWTTLPQKIVVVAERLHQVQIENKSAVELIKRYSGSETLIYADPPYLLSTRSGRMYKYEMTEEDHIELLDTLNAHNGPVLLSGYDHPLYNEQLNHWKREEFQVNAEFGLPRTEVLWINPIAAGKIGQQVMMF